jgi:hypothetical protein
MLLVSLVRLNFANGVLAKEDVKLKDFRDFAKVLLSDKSAPQLDAYAEYSVIRPTNACSENGGVEYKIRLDAQGQLDLRRFRSSSESESPNPGEYHGKAGATLWQQTLTHFTKMDWVTAPPGLPMPSPSDTHQRLVLSNGKKEVEYSIAGNLPMGQDLISNGFDQMDLLLPLAKDTNWSVSLAVSHSRLKRGVLEVDMTWSASGQMPIQISPPSKGTQTDCGAVSLAWFNVKQASAGITPLPPEMHYASLVDALVPATHPAGTQKSRLQFSLGTQEKQKRTGRLTHLGLEIKTRPDSPAVKITLFSPLINF